MITDCHTTRKELCVLFIDVSPTHVPRISREIIERYDHLLRLSLSSSYLLDDEMTSSGTIAAVLSHCHTRRQWTRQRPRRGIFDGFRCRSSFINKHGKIRVDVSFLFSGHVLYCSRFKWLYVTRSQGNLARFRPPTGIFRHRVCCDHDRVNASECGSGFE